MRYLGTAAFRKSNLGLLLRFIHAEELVYALANDLRSEYVRKGISQDRKAKVFLFYGKAVKSAYYYAHKVIKLLR